MGRGSRFVLACALAMAAGCARDRQAPVESGPTVEPAVAPSVAPIVAPAVTPREVQVGSSVRGEPIVLYRFGEADSAPTLIIAAIHGDEPEALFVGRRLVEHLRENPDAAKGKPVAVIPVANPDGVAQRSRTNANGVDCNRNFPASNWKLTRAGRNHAGLSPASEPETRAIISAIEMLRPARVVSIHSPLRCNNHDGPEEAAALARLMAQYNGYPVVGSIGYATPGSFGTWAGSDLGIAVVTLELPPRTPGERAWQENRDALLAVIQSPLAASHDSSASIP
jgi:protein MpaA